MKSVPSIPWKTWSLSLVVDADVPAFALRTYLEQFDVRAILRRAIGDRRVVAACDVGCGYGRMTVVLGELTDAVVGFERQPEFVEIARQLHPAFTIHQVASLASLPVPPRSFDLVLSFTVLQHLTDHVVAHAAAEIRRIVRPGGLVLLCEEMDPALRQGDVLDDNGMCVIGRPVEAYAALLSPLRLVDTTPRRVEPTYPRRDVGTYMLFQS